MMKRQEYELTAQELWTLRQILGITQGATNLADHYYKSTLMDRFGFTNQEEDMLHYDEMAFQDPNTGEDRIRFRFDQQTTLSRTLSKRDCLKIIQVAEQNAPLFSTDSFRRILPALLRFGWKPPENKEDEDDPEPETDMAATGTRPPVME